jgi:hypothetical protein
MKRRFTGIVLVGVLIPMLLSACVLPTTHRYNVLFVFESPNRGELYPVAPIDIVVGLWVPYPPGYRPGYLPGSLPILNQVVFFANGLEIGRATFISSDSYADPTASTTTGLLFHASRTWTPPSPGLYYIQAQAILMLGGPVSGDYSDAQPVCVVGPGFSLRECVPTPTSLVPLSAPFSFSTITPAPNLTATPASAKDCPSGTFFADQTHRCIPIQILPTKPGHGGGCSQYGDPSSCTSNGCSWDKPSSTCH